MTRKEQKQQVKDSLRTALTHIENRVDVTLYQQIEDRLLGWLRQQAPGTRLPAERWLTEQIGVNRRTVRKALANLAEKGFLKRFPKGMIVGEKHLIPVTAANDVEPAAANLHPLLANSDYLASQQTLNIAILEYMPSQRFFWENAVKSINEASHGFELKINWVADCIDSIDKYVEYIHKHGCDLIMTSGGMLEPLKQQDLLVPVSEAACEQLRSDQFFWRTLTEEIDPVLPLGVPIHFNLSLVAWNEAFFGGTRQAPRAEISVDTLISNCDRIADDLEDGQTLVTPVVMLPNRLGQPELPLTLDTFKKRVRRIFSCCRQLGRFREYLDCGKMVESTAHEAFINGKSAFFVGNGVYVLTNIDLLGFPCGFSCLIPEEGLRNPCTSTNLCITKISRNPRLCEYAIKQLLSEPIQKMLAAAPVNCPVLCKALPDFAVRLGFRDDRLLRRLIERTHCLPRNQVAWEWFVKAGLEELIGSSIRGDVRIGRELYREAETIARAIYPEILG